MDGVSARDFVAETVFDLTALCTTLSKICEELILWSTYEFGVIDMADEYSSTSSIMPQKKNPDVAELARGKSTIVNGELVTILTILKAIPYTYNRDLQEITPHLWNALKVTEDTLSIVTRMLLSVKFNTERCAELAGRNFATATDLADIMVREELDDDLIQNALNPTENVKIRRVLGGPAPKMVELARDNIKVFLNEEFEKKGI